MKSRATKCFAAAFLLGLIVVSACKNEQSGMGEYPISQVPFTEVNLTDQFWAPKIKINKEVTIPIAFGYCESTGRVKNFEIAGGLSEGDSFLTTYPFDDSDVYKIIEGAAYTLHSVPDLKLEAYCDTLIYKIGMAQEEDGYLYTNRTINGEDNVHPWGKGGRWIGVHLHSHELYNLGHMYEAAVAYYQATGKRNFLDIAIKSADLVYKSFGWDKTDLYKNYPGHQEIELGLVKLYGASGDERYLELAKFFLDVRGDGEVYNQAHLPVVEQTEAVGHSVRATYMYSGMADVAALYNDESYVNAISKIWEDIVYKKLYVTGGIGASGGNEGFGDPYYLPNMTAYCETCASIGNIFMNYRLFLQQGDSKYYDVLERTLYNAMLSGVALTGDHFFYPNVLESYGQHERSEWFGCACCPSNISRFVPAVPGYIYAKDNKSVYVNLFADNNAEFEFKGKQFSISQETNYPWEGQIEITVNPAEAQKFELKVRIPGWARNEALPGDLYKFVGKSEKQIELSVNGKLHKVELENGYAEIERKWSPGDKVSVVLPMEIRKLIADERVEADNGRVTIQRGPMIYCAEWVDNAEGNTRNLLLDIDSEMTSEFIPDMLNGTQIIKASGCQSSLNIEGEVEFSKKQDITLIPYHLWANRGTGDMLVWLPVKDTAVAPTPAPTIAFTSKMSGSRGTKSVRAVADQYEPLNSNDHSKPYSHWWPNKDSWEYLQYDFAKPETVSASSVYWFDDGPDGGCRIPDKWELQYKSGNNWMAVHAKGEYTITKDGWDRLEFSAVYTSALRLRVKLNKEWSSGVHEWVVE